MNRVLLIAGTIVASWLGMQAVHELGHVLGAWLTSGRVTNVALHPLAISRTDLGENPSPLTVAWAGPLFGVLAPVGMWLLVSWRRSRVAFLLRFFAGFCLIANGLYIALGSIGGVGDAGDLRNHGADAWQLWLFGAVATPAGLLMWHRQGKHFGVNSAENCPSVGSVGTALGACIVLVILGVWIGE